MPRLLLLLSLTIAGPVFLAAQPQSRATPSPSPAASPSPASTSVTVDDLDVADLKKAIGLIQEKYFQPARVSAPEIERATLEGLLDRLGSGVRLTSPRALPTPAPSPFYREIIAGHIGYMRPGDLSRAQVEELDTTLRGFGGKKADALILDLRGSVETSDYAAAAEFADRFVAKDEALFQLRDPRGGNPREFVAKLPPSYSGVLVVLVDEDTAGAAEVLAAVLRRQKAILIGEKTAGRAIDYADLPLPSGKILRLAVAEAALPNQTASLGEGVQPDLYVSLPSADKDQMFQQSLSKGMEQFVFESDRPHLNEAALLAGTNPEIAAAQAAQERRKNGERPPPHDTVLQRAVDVVTSIAVFEKQPGRSP
jgi:hypothetical protein